MLSLEQLVQEAVEKNPRIRAARERHTALKEKIPQSGALEDPMLGLGVVNLPTDFDFNDEAMTMKEISLSQKFLFPGKRGLSAAAATKEADAGAAEAEDIVNQVVTEIKTAFFDLSHIYRAVEVTQRNKLILEELADITMSRYSLGQGIQADVVSIQVEISRMADDLIMLAQKKHSLAARLNYLLNRPPNSPLGRPAEVRFRPAEFSIEDLQHQAVAENPMLRALKQEIAVYDKTIALAKRDYFPDFNLKFAYGQRDDRLDMVTGMVEMNLPVYVKSKQERKVAEGYAGIRSAQARYDDALNELLYMTAESGSMAQRLERKIELYRTGIIPQARLQVDTAASAYMVNKADFMTLRDSRMRLYRFELDYHEALTDYEKNLAELEALVGRALPRGVRQ